MKDIIEYLQNLLKAKYLGEYPSGHMRAQILRFQLLDDSKKVIAKIAEKSNLEASKDIEANLIGYNQIKAIGGKDILSSYLREVVTDDAKVLIMNDFGPSIKNNNSGLVGAKLLWENFRNIIISTRQEIPVKADTLPLFVSEVLSFIEEFAGKGKTDLVDLIRHTNLSDNYGRPALMLLDFTPDNLFLTNEGLSFIDLWKQDGYLGHPAVSIGQFLTLTRIYNLLDNKEIADFLRLSCLEELPNLLACSVSSIEKSLRLGSTLQLILSAYVRQESDPTTAQSFRDEARRMWTT